MSDNRSVLSGRSIATLSLAIAAVIAVSGVGMMSLFWITYSGDSPRGFTYYVAATWGDGVFLPLAAAAIVWHTAVAIKAAKQTTPSCRFSRVALGIMLVGAWVGMACGALLQFDWLMDEDVTTNWTLPVAHKFNAAGLYHAVFLMSMFALFSALSLLLLQRVSLAPGQQGLATSSARLSYLLAWTGMSGYAYLHLHDNAPLTVNEWKEFGHTTCCFMIVGAMHAVGSAVFAWIKDGYPVELRKRIFPDVHDMTSGVFLGASTTSILAGEPSENVRSSYIPIILSLFLVGMVVSYRDGICDLIRRVVSALAVGSFAGILFQMTESKLEIVATGVIVVALNGCTFSVERKRTTRRILLSRHALNVALAVNCCAHVWGLGWIEERAGLIITLTVMYLTTLFREYVTNIDHDPYADVKRVHDVKTRYWVAFISMFAALVILLLTSVVDEGTQGLVPVANSESIVCAGAFVIILGTYMKFRREDSRMPTLISLGILVVLYGVIVSYISGLRAPLFDDWRSWIVIVPVVGSAVFVANGVGSNMILLRGGDRNVMGWSIVITVFLGTACVFVSAVVPTRVEDVHYAPSILSPLTGVVGCLFGSLVPALVACRIISSRKSEGAREGKSVLLDVGVAGVTQDVVMGAAIVIAVGLFPAHILAYGALTADAILLLLVLLFAAGSAVHFALCNNARHLRSETATPRLFRKTLFGQSNDKLSALKQHLALKAHLERQAWIVMIACFPVSLLFFSWQLIRHYGARASNAGPRDVPNLNVDEDFGTVLYDTYLLEVGVRSGLHSKGVTEELGLPVSVSTKWWIYDIFVTL